MATDTKPAEFDPETMSHRDLPEGKAIISVPPRLFSMMTAVIEARQNNLGDVRLTYEDGTTVIGRIDYTISHQEGDAANFLKIVGDVVQAAARQ